MQKPLPPDYVRPTQAEYLAASSAHTQAGFLPWLQGHEAELRKHYVPAEAPADSEPVLELAELDSDIAAGETEPAPDAAPFFDPRAALVPTVDAQPAEEAYKRPSVADWQAAGYAKDLTGDALSEAYKRFFENFEAKMAEKPKPAGSASGELSPSA